MMFVIYICDVREMYVLVVDSLCVMVYIYMYLSIVWMQIKKNLKFLWSLPRALTIALGKE